MANLLDRLNELFDEVKQELAVLFAISIGIFLFILFFNPFGFNNQNINNQLLIISGFGAIIFILGSVFYTLIPAALPGLFRITEREERPDYMISILVWILSSTAFAFYLHFVGKINLTMYLMFKILVICIFPPAILWIYYINLILKNKVSELNTRVRELQSELNGLKRDKKPEIIVLESENKTDKIEIPFADLILIKSADNYVEVYYSEESQLKKKLLRITLQKVEDSLSTFPEFLRCHRSSIFNIIYAEKIIQKYAGTRLKLNVYDLEVPVSRQYIRHVRELINRS